MKYEKNITYFGCHFDNNNNDDDDDDSGDIVMMTLVITLTRPDEKRVVGVSLAKGVPKECIYTLS